MSQALLRSDETLWFARRHGKGGVKSIGTHKRAHSMNVTVIGTSDRQATGVAILFPVEGIGYEVRDPGQLKVIIEKLQDAYSMIVGQGQSKIISFNNKPEWNERGFEQALTAPFHSPITSRRARVGR